MNQFDSFRGVTRRSIWDHYVSPPTCIAFPESSGSSSGNNIDINVAPVLRGAAPGPLAAVVEGSSVRLSWPVQVGSYAYVVYRSTSTLGPFSILVSGLIENELVDVPPNPGSFSYRLTALEPAFGETEASDTVTVVV